MYASYSRQQKADKTPTEKKNDDRYKISADSMKKG